MSLLARVAHQVADQDLLASASQSPVLIFIPSIDHMPLVHDSRITRIDIARDGIAFDRAWNVYVSFALERDVGRRLLRVGLMHDDCARLRGTRREKHEAGTGQ